MTARRIFLQASFVAIFGGLFLILSRMPFLFWREDENRLLVTFRNASPTSTICREASEAEKSKMLPHMRQDRICERNRPATTLRVVVDGQERLNKVFTPLGMSQDGISAAYEWFSLPAGTHDVDVAIRDAASGEDWNHRYRQQLGFSKDGRRVIEYSREHGFHVYGEGKDGEKQLL